MIRMTGVRIMGMRGRGIELFSAGHVASLKDNNINAHQGCWKQICVLYDKLKAYMY